LEGALGGVETGSVLAGRAVAGLFLRLTDVAGVIGRTEAGEGVGLVLA